MAKIIRRAETKLKTSKLFSPLIIFIDYYFGLSNEE